MSSDRPGVPSGPGASDVPRGPRAETLDPAALADLIRKRIRDVPDYPQPGISFKDITPVLADGPLFVAVVDELATGQRPVDKVAGIEARGFILAAPVATRLGAGFVRSARSGSCPPLPTPRTTSSNTGRPRSRSTPTPSSRATAC